MMKFPCLILALVFLTLSLFVAVAISRAEPDFTKDTAAWLAEPEPPLAKSWWNKLFVPAIPYDTTEKILYGALIATNAADLGTTVVALDRGAVEVNPIVGANPSTGTLLAVKVIGVTLVTIGANLVDHTLRKIFLGGASLVFGGASLNNYNVLRDM